MKRTAVLIVDDSKINRDMLTIILEDEYGSVITAENGVKAIEKIEESRESISVILLDICMPIMDGLEVLGYMKKNDLIDDIPVLIISADSSQKMEKQTLEMGAADFIKKPFDTAIIRRRVKNISDLYTYKAELEEKVEEQVVELKAKAEELRKSKLAIIDVIGTIVESRNLESGEHIQRVKTYTNIIANKIKDLYPEYGLTDELIKLITNASALHDIGKISIPDNVLLKPGKLTKEEFEIMKTHTTEGCKILQNIKNAWSEDFATIAYQICRYHHERYDGSGYPDKLAGDDIPIAAQIVSIADVFDALINKRCYKDALPYEVAIEMIVGGDCGVFSEKLLKCFLESRSLLCNNYLS